MIKDLKQYKNFAKLFNVVYSLKDTQGLYSKLYHNLVNLTEFEILDIENRLPNFNDKLDVIMYLES